MRVFFRFPQDPLDHTLVLEMLLLVDVLFALGTTSRCRARVVFRLWGNRVTFV